MREEYIVLELCQGPNALTVFDYIWLHSAGMHHGRVLQPSR